MLLHELEEPLLAGGSDAIPSAWTDPAGWLERAGANVASRQFDLERFTGWMIATPDAAVPVPSLAGLITLCDRALQADALTADARSAVERAGRDAEDLLDRAERIGVLADDLIEETEFGFLFNAERQLFSIGFSVVGRTARQLLLRHPRLGGASGQLHGDRDRQDSRTSTGSSSDAR